MWRRVAFVGLVLSLAAPVGSPDARGPQEAAAQARLSPAAGTVLTESAVIATGDHLLPSADLDHPAITIRASNVTIDFSGAVLRGAPAGADPDSFTGVAVLVDGGEHVTIRNLIARGYKVGVLVRHSPRVHITGADLGYNWKSRLYSLVEHESLVDWLSYHRNEKDEWLGGGAGIYLADSDEAEVDHTSVVQGQNGLMLARSSWRENLEQHVLVSLGDRDRALSRQRQHDCAQPGGLVRSRLQRHVL